MTAAANSSPTAFSVAELKAATTIANCAGGSQVVEQQQEIDTIIRT
jgi:hypothetical protein